jgi:hypothetical protein
MQQDQVRSVMSVRNYLPILTLIAIIVGCSWNTLNEKEIKNMKAEYLLQYGKQPDLWPVVIGMKDDYTDIFSVPVENAVGTNCLNNAITLLRFSKDKVEYDQVRKDFINGVGEGDKYYPGIFSDSWIGYTQTRGFLLFNLKDKSFADHIPIRSGDEYFKDVKPFNGSKLQFVFHVHEAYFMEGIRHLKVIEFDGKGNFREISQMKTGEDKIGYSEPWAIQNRTIFVYNNDSIKITAYDINFNPIHHPFCDVFNHIKDFRRIDQLVIHPSLPFAILVEIDREIKDNYQVWLVRWDHPDKEKRIVELLGQAISISPDFSAFEGLTCTDFQFSPDGNWLVFRDKSEAAKQRSPNPKFIAIPVDGNREMPLGVPKELGRVLRENAKPTSTAWIIEPVSFVVSDGLMLYKWELGKLKREFKD